MPVPYFPKKRLEFKLGLFRNGDTRHLSDDSGIDANSADGAPASSPAPGPGCRDSPRSQKGGGAAGCVGGCQQVERPSQGGVQMVQNRGFSASTE
jgi:hypothetical protein